MSKRTYYMREGDKPDRIPPFSLRLTKDERISLERRAGSMPLGSYIKSLLFAENAPTYRARRKPPVADQKSLADVLACLGASLIANNLNQLAHAANTGTLYFDSDTKIEIERAAGDIRAMRLMLMRALGMSVDDQPKPQETPSPAELNTGPSRTKIWSGSTLMSGKSVAKRSAYSQCVVALRPASNPACASRKAPVQVDP